MKKGILLLLAFVFLLGANAFSQNKKKTAPTPETKETPKHFLEDISLGGFKWRSVGPALTSGRISDFAVQPGKRSTYYVAASSGGVWKTENAGTTFEPIFDSQGSYSIGCVTLDPNNPNIVWVGTGENNNQRSVAYGDGVYKSIDGGKSWQNMGLKNSEHIAKIIVDPRNSDVVYVAAIGPLWSEGGDRGIYKTTDGGKTWEMVLKDASGKALTDEHTGVTDLVTDPRNPDVMYAATHQRRRHVFTYVSGGPGSSLYKTTDGGRTWSKCTKGLPTVDLGRIGLAISPADPEIIYAIVEAAEGKGGFYKSTDRGASWQRQSGHVTSGNYYCEIFAHPAEPNTVISMDVFNQISRDGGRTWTQLGEEYKHVDNHVHWIDPEDVNYHLSGNDGGIYESFDAGKTWKFMANLPVTQFYKVEVDNTLPFYHIHGGTQDNFSMGGPSRTRNSHGITNSDWYVTSLGDGFESQIDPENPDIVYAQSQYGGLVRYDRASGEMTGIQPQPREGENKYRWNWDAPLAVSKHKPTRLYFAANKVFRSENRGDSWEVISEDLTRQIDRNTLPVMGRVQSIDAVAKNASTSEYGNIVALSESPLDENLLYIGTDDGLIQITEDGGKSWTKIAIFPGVPEFTYVNMLIASRHDVNVVYATFNNHKRGDFKPYVYKSTDKGRNWTNITANLPERGSSYSIAEDHVSKDLIFVGTEFSFFFSADGGKYWKKLANGLPTIAVRDIAIQTRENDLVLGTFGRGFYVLDDYSPLRQFSAERFAAEAQIFPVKTGLVFIEAGPIGFRTGKGFLGHSFYTAENPPMGAVFTWYVKDDMKTLKEKRQEAEKKNIKEGKPIRYPTYEELQAEQNEEAPYLLFTIRNTAGEIVRQLRSSPRKGVNRLVWDGRYVSKSPVTLNPAPGVPWGNPDAGKLAMPGDYSISMDKSENGVISHLVSPVPFKIQSLGGVTLPATDRLALDKFLREAAELERAFAGATRALGEVDNRVRHMKQAAFAVAKPVPELLAEIKKLEDKLQGIRTAFSGDRVAPQIDRGTTASISDRIGTIAGDLWNSTSAPGDTQKEAMRIAGAAFNSELAKLKVIIESDLKKIEEMLEKEKAPYTPGRIPSWGRN
jgi:photosystem II stability/assembly factor-like uncharacterized protein